MAQPCKSLSWQTTSLSNRSPRRGIFSKTAALLPIIREIPVVELHKGHQPFPKSLDIWRHQPGHCSPSPQHTDIYWWANHSEGSSHIPKSCSEWLHRPRRATSVAILKGSASQNRVWSVPSIPTYLACEGLSFPFPTSIKNPSLLKIMLFLLPN